MAVRKVCKWCVVILLLVGVCGVVAAYWFWSRSDELLRTAILARCAEIAPEWEVNIGRARFDWNRRVHLVDVSLKAAHQEELIVTLPEIVVNVDRERFVERHEIDVQKIRLFRPTFNLVRDRAGNWNWNDLPPLATSKKSLPECEISEATVWIRVEQDDGAAPAKLLVHHGDLQLVPSGKRRFAVKGEMQIDRAGTVIVDGQWDVDAKTWTFGGQMKEAPVGHELIELAASTSPELRMKLAQVQARLQNLGELPAEINPGPGRSTFPLVSQHRTANPSNTLPERAPPPPIAMDTIPNLGVSGTLDVNFHISRRDQDAEPEFKMWVEMKGGQVDNSALPFPLYDLKGKIYWDNRQLVITSLTAQNGVTQLELAPSVDRQGMATPNRLDLTVSNLVLDDRLQSRLPAHWRKIYDTLSPTGQVDIRGALQYDPQGGTWRPENFLLTARDGTVTYTKFPYPIHAVTGTIRQQAGILEFFFQGRAGLKPVTLKGYVKNPGPGAEAAFDIRVDGLPLDETLLAACSLEMQKTLTSLNLTGLVDVSLYLFCPQGPNHKFQQQWVAQLRNASLEYDQFPYRLTNLTGSVAYSSVEKKWTFPDLKAVHGSAQVTGSGFFSKQSEPGRLELTVEAQGAHFDRQLRQALPPNLQQVWDELSPTGRLNVVATVDWIPGQAVVVSLPEMNVYEANMMLKAFPYPLTDVQARLSYANGTPNGQLDVLSFSAKHDDTKVSANGFGNLDPFGDWTFRIEELEVDDLIPDRLFRRALPAGLRGAIESLNPRGPLSLSGMLEFRGTGRKSDEITAAWDLEIVLTKATVNTGLELKNVSGVVTARGTWDGVHVESGGAVDLDLVVVLDHQLTQLLGPYRLSDQKLVVGSAAVLVTKPPSGGQSRPIGVAQRITAKAVGGLVTLDGVIMLNEEPSYHVIATMSQGRLEQYARRYLPRVKNVRGTMNGWIDLEGRGTSAEGITGRGQLQISQAALYELPIMVQVFKVLSFVPPDRTAFKYALLDFTVARNRFRFDRIDLVGDAISLRGRGEARFDGELNLDFYSMLSRNQLPIPLIKPLLDEATKGWVGVEVRGKVSAPVAKIKAVPTLDGALRRFLAAFESLPRGTMPRLIIAPLTPAQIVPLSRPSSPRMRMLRPR